MVSAGPRRQRRACITLVLRCYASNSDMVSACIDGALKAPRGLWSCFRIASSSSSSRAFRALPLLPRLSLFRAPRFALALRGAGGLPVPDLALVFAAPDPVCSFACRAFELCAPIKFTTAPSQPQARDAATYRHLGLLAQRKGLGNVSKVQRSNVEDVLRFLRMRRIRANVPREPVTSQLRQLVCTAAMSTAHSAQAPKPPNQSYRWRRADEFLHVHLPPHCAELELSFHLSLGQPCLLALLAPYFAAEPLELPVPSLTSVGVICCGFQHLADGGHRLSQRREHRSVGDGRQLQLVLAKNLPRHSRGVSSGTRRGAQRPWHSRSGNRFPRAARTTQRSQTCHREPCAQYDARSCTMHGSQ